MLNSLSSWPKAAPVSAELASSSVFVEALAFADDQVCEVCCSSVAVVGEILQHLHRAAFVLHDRHQVGRRHLRRMNFSPRASARNWSGSGMAVISK